MFEHLIPHATDKERALERAASFEAIGSIEALGDLTEPGRIRAGFLPWLAYRFGADLWFDAWGEEKRRSVVAQQLQLHRLKGTADGFRAMLALVDAEALQILAYPKRSYATGGITKEQRNAWLARMPQIRIYYHTAYGARGQDAFAGHNAALDAFARPDRGEAIYGRRAVLRAPDGTETPLRRSSIERVGEVRSAMSFDRVHVPGEAGAAVFAGHRPGGFATMKGKQPRIVSMALDRSYDAVSSTLHLDTVEPGLTPINVRYERGSNRVPGGLRQFAAGLPKRFAAHDVAERNLFDRIYLHDPEVDAPWTRAHSFAGHARVNLKPYHAEALIKAREATSKRWAFARQSFSSRNFSARNHTQHIKSVFEAARRSKALRDKLLISTKTTRKRTFKDGLKLAQRPKLGQKLPNRIG